MRALQRKPLSHTQHNRANVIWQNNLLTYLGKSGTTLGESSTTLNNMPQTNEGSNERR
jgi:hypothetical protein